AADNHAGYNSGGVANMFNNGSADFHTPATSVVTVPATPVIPASVVTTPTAPVVTPLAPDTLVFRVSGDSYQGDPHFQVRVDGHQIGGTLTTSTSHAAGQTQDITLTGAFGTGAHYIAVQFLDDVYGGIAPADRNLYVRQVSLNGHTLAG
ncbi:hypothetical protein MKK64_26785, partial [Methylobacterium sp. E-025]|uniref:carbohydrate-binding domain-containing protein n=1 Tax=Methylobacterium sp. E-025 TaxID=2836561 RepID=UPI002444EFCE